MAVSPSTTHSAADSPTVSGRFVTRERVRAMESLAAVVAHEIRASVMGVTSAAQLLRYSVPADPIVDRSIGRILQESERLSAVHEALTEYATEAPPRLVLTDPDEIWSRVIVNLRGALEAHSIALTRRDAGDRAACLIDIDQMTRAFERIARHALGRVPAGSALHIESAIDADGEWQSTLTPGVALVETADVERSSFLLALANRTLVSHGGEIVEGASTGEAMVTIRLPGSARTP